ncbi:MAG: hypothetical protein Solumvirus4_29 [Solumvirus sp.]|uniref:Uncharacterized protein n=1 Tax=Solumvirus sp. TaxID=2487773 RepID=A0A3G5AJ43_9VIRU|nr:MAG: hypothetical protein Solumvirus4_29 [Solumvirus sp.]
MRTLLLIYENVLVTNEEKQKESELVKLFDEEMKPILDYNQETFNLFAEGKISSYEYQDESKMDREEITEIIDKYVLMGLGSYRYKQFSV